MPWPTPLFYITYRRGKYFYLGNFRIRSGMARPTNMTRLRFLPGGKEQEKGTGAVSPTQGGQGLAGTRAMVGWQQPRR